VLTVGSSTDRMEREMDGLQRLLVASRTQGRQPSNIRGSRPDK